MKKNILRKILLLFIIIAFTACSSLFSSQNGNIGEKKLSPLASDPEFMNSLHIIQNDTTNTRAIVKGDGTMVINTMRPYIDNIDLLNDARTGKPTYFYKVVNGEETKNKLYTDEYTGEVYLYPETVNKAVFYDKEGNEIGLEADTYGSELIIGDKIFYNDMSKDYDSNLYIFDVRTKETIKSPKERVVYYGSHVLISSEPYGAEDSKKEILVCDDNLNVLWTIDNYSYSDIKKFDDIEICEVRATIIKNTEKPLRDLDYGTDYEYKYNYLDKDLKLIFDDYLDEGFYFDDSPIVTLHRGDIEFDYDFKNMKKVGEDRPYKGYSNNNEKYMNERKAYESDANLIKSLDDKYAYVDIKIYGEKVLFFAHYADENVDYNDPEYMYNDHIDVYSLDHELIGSFENLNTTYEEDGYFEVNYDTVYDFDLNVVRTFDERACIIRYSVGDFVYFTDAYNEKYDTRPKYNIYDKDFNLLYDNVVYDSAYAFGDQYFTFVSDGHTKILDPSLTLIKEYDMEISIQGWYENDKYKVFNDLKTKRMGVIDNKFNVIIKGLKSINGLEDDCLVFSNGFRYGLMDYNGLEICSFSIFNTMNEDSKFSDANIKII